MCSLPSPLTIELCLEVTLRTSKAGWNPNQVVAYLSERVKVHVRIRRDAEASFKVEEENAEPGKKVFRHNQALQPVDGHVRVIEKASDVDGLVDRDDSR